jgi:hypothetical protein
MYNTTRETLRHQQTWIQTVQVSTVQYIREDKLHLFDNKLVQKMQKFDKGTRNIAGAEALDIYVSNAMTKGTDIEWNIDIMENIIITTCRRTFRRHKTTNNRKKNSVPWWNNHLTVIRKKVNAIRRLFQRTKNDLALRERRKEKYKEAKRNYQAEINQAKINSWKEFCNVEASVNPWSQVYKIAAGKTKEVSKMTTITRPDGTDNWPTRNHKRNPRPPIQRRRRRRKPTP